MYYFSEKFIAGLQNKSEGFQNKFYEIIDEICEYLDDDEEKQGFQQYIEANHSYENPGNILYSTKMVMGGTYQESEFEALKEKIHLYLFGLFDDFGAAEAIVEVPHIVVCISAPCGCFGDEDIKFIRNLLSFERLCRGHLPVETTVVLNETNDSGVSCYVALLK